VQVTHVLLSVADHVGDLALVVVRGGRRVLRRLRVRADCRVVLVFVKVVVPVGRVRLRLLALGTGVRLFMRLVHALGGVQFVGFRAFLL
jgi:hypothetical protein